MNHLLELIRLHLNRQDNADDWAKAIREDLARRRGTGLSAALGARCAEAFGPRHYHPRGTPSPARGPVK
jgi:hypothetical protein